MSSAVKTVAAQQLVLMCGLIDENQRGHYFLSDASLINMSSQKIRVLNWLLYQLVELYPSLVWMQTESMDPHVRGIMISWYPERMR